MSRASRFFSRTIPFFCQATAVVFVAGAAGVSDLGTPSASAQSPYRPVVIEAPPLIPIPPLQRTQIPIAPPLPVHRTARFSSAPLDAASTPPTLSPTIQPDQINWGRPTLTMNTTSAPSPTTLAPLGNTSPCPCCGADRTLAYRQAAPLYGPPTYVTPMAATPAAYFQPVPITTWKPAPASSANSRYYVGQGLLGQPKIFVTGQPLRNAVRALSP